MLHATDTHQSDRRSWFEFRHTWFGLGIKIINNNIINKLTYGRTVS